MARTVIIGNGISGITAARHIRKRSDGPITVISGESAHFFSRTALMYIYMGHMRYEHTKPYEDGFWEKNRIDLRQAWVQRVDCSSRSVILEDGSAIAYDTLIIATGSRTARFGWPGQDLPGVQGLYSLQDLELMERSTKGIQRAVIVGGGLIGVEMAEMLRSRGIGVTFLVREKNFWGSVLPTQEAQLIGRHIREHGVDLRLETELDAILPGPDGRVAAVLTKPGEEISCQFVGLTTGVTPNIELLAGSDIATERGVLVNECLETNVPDVFAIGDCAQFRQHPDSERKAIEQVWYTGRIMGETVARTITGERTPYHPGKWFNSAKFFDIEYQTYGWVRPQLKNDEADLHWEHPDGKKALHFVWEREKRVLRGVNAFGIRLKHAVVDRWLNDHCTMDTVVDQLDQAQFDPEFHRSIGPQIRQAFQEYNKIPA